MFENLERKIKSIMEMGIPGSDILVYYKGEEIYRSYEGYFDLENKIPMNGRELYNLYSASKPITCTAALQLVEKGILMLDAPLCEYLPEFEKMYVKSGDTVVPAKNLIRIKDLFCMTAGFSYDTDSDAVRNAKKETNGACPTVETIKYLAQEPLLFEPGTRWNYSLCHDVLAAVVEAVSGIRFGEYVRKNIFEPLGMKNSTFLLPQEKTDSICAQYRYNPEKKSLENCGKEIQYYKFGSEYESGGAGGISTAEDYIKFTEAMRKGDIILSREMTDKMRTDIIPTIDGSGYWPGVRGYGYGLGVSCPRKGDKNSTDFGWGGAAGACMRIDIENEFTMFFGMHVLNTAVGDGHSELIEAVKKDLKGMVD